MYVCSLILLLCCSCVFHYLLHLIKLFSPHSNLALHLNPLFLCHLPNHVSLNNNFFLKLINLRIDKFSLDCLNDPLFNVFFFNVENACKLIVGKFILSYLAKLYVPLLS